MLLLIWLHIEGMSYLHRVESLSKHYDNFFLNGSFWTLLMVAYSATKTVVSNICPEGWICYIKSFNFALEAILNN